MISQGTIDQIGEDNPLLAEGLDSINRSRGVLGQGVVPNPALIERVNDALRAVLDGKRQMLAVLEAELARRQRVSADVTIEGEYHVINEGGTR